ncbi:MAG: EVE domain-containing protein [Rikenellaceae bacterium]|nr:EVE domain-containing protein [Rikenellaceae bacterium]
MSKMYMVRAGRKNYLFDDFIESDLIAIGWNDLGDLSKITSLSELKKRLSHTYPEYKEQAVHMNAGQINRFVREIKKGDYAVSYNSEKRIYAVGEVVSEYVYDQNFEYNHIRKMKWIGEVPRDILSTPTKNSLGSIATIFEISGEARKELENGLKQPTKKEVSSIDIEDVNNTLDFIKEDFEARANEFIKDKILSLDWCQMQELVAAIIRSLGFKTRISPKGSDRGKDIFASPDGLGLEEPRILIEVKHREGQIGAPDIRSFLGGFRPGSKGIYVSTGGFTKDAKYEAERANFPLTLIDADYLVDLIISNYDNFDMDGCSLVPLRKIYWPL